MRVPISDGLNVRGRAILPYDAVFLVVARRATDPLLSRALAPLVGAIPVERMHTANNRVDRADVPASSVAARWLGRKIAASLSRAVMMVR